MRREMFVKVIVILFEFMFISNDFASSSSIAKSSNQAEETMLESLLSADQSTCMLLTYSLPARDISVLSESESVRKVGLMTRSSGYDKSWTWQPMAPCFIGISSDLHMMHLQKILSDLPKRRLVVLTSSVNTEMLNNLAGLDRRHHPPVLLSTASNSLSDLLVPCRTRRSGIMSRIVRADIWRHGEWFMRQDIGEEGLERLCNYGQHEMFGKQITASLFGLYPRVTIDKSFNPPKVTGVVPDLFKVLADQLGFQAKYRIAENWGVLLENGTIYGTRGDVVNGYSDMGLEIAIYHRGPDAPPSEGNMSMSNFWMWRNHVFIVKSPTRRPEWRNLLYPFDDNTWIVIAISTLAVTITFVIIMCSHKYDMLKSKTEIAFVLAFMPYGVLLRQHKPCWDQLVHKVRSGHFLYVVWVIVAWFIVEFYESNLKASLMIKSYEPTIETLWELIEKDLPVHIQDVVLQKFEEPTVNDRLTMALAKQCRRKGTIISLTTNQPFGTEETVLRFGGAAFYYEEPLYPVKENYMRQNLRYPLTFIKQRYYFTTAGIVVPYCSPRLDIINPVMRNIFESGIIFKFYSKYTFEFHHNVPYNFDKEAYEDTQNNWDKDSLHMNHFMLPILFLIFCLIFSYIVLCFEIFTFNVVLNVVVISSIINASRNK